MTSARADSNRLHARARQARRQSDRLLAHPRVLPAVRASLLADVADRPRAHPHVGPGDLRRQPPVVPRSLRDRDDRAPAALLRGQAGALPAPADRLVPQLDGRLPGQPRRRRRRHARDRARDPQPRRLRADLPRGHAHPARRPRPPEARPRPPGARDRRADRAGGRHGHRGGPQGLADPPAQGPDPGRPPAHLPEGRVALAAARRRRHRPRVAERDAPVGVARRPAAAAPRRRHRRRLVGHQRRRHARPRRPRGRPRHAHARAGRGDGRHARQRALPARRRAPQVGQPRPRRRPRALAPRPRVLRGARRRAARDGGGARRRASPRAPACWSCPRASCRRSAPCPPPS